jgi:hypothetical protein
MRAVGGDADRRHAAEVLIGRAQRQPATKFEQSELPAGAVANIEGGDAFGANLDSGGRRGGHQRLRIGDHRKREQGREQ